MGKGGLRSEGNPKMWTKNKSMDEGESNERRRHSLPKWAAAVRSFLNTHTYGGEQREKDSVVTRRAALQQTAIAQVELDDDVVDGAQDEPDLLRLGRARKVDIDLFRRALVQADEAAREVVARGLQVGPAGVVGEVVGDRRTGEFLPEQVDLKGD